LWDAALNILVKQHAHKAISTQLALILRIMGNSMMLLVVWDLTFSLACLDPVHFLDVAKPMHVLEEAVLAVI
jgi:hypothetical protein